MLLVLGDLHLTDQSRDSHRFNVFPWIVKQQRKRDPVATILLGDLTDQKDRHSATLVNAIVANLVTLKPPIYILRGNHDYNRDQSSPFFNFLNHIEGITFVTEPALVTAGKKLGFVPHYRSQAEFDNAVHKVVSDCHASGAGSGPDGWFVHQTFEGAIAESGVRLNGLAASPIELLRPPLGTLAGDVHRPQRQNMVTYVGCPYQVRFGDDFEPRSIWLEANGNTKDLIFDAPRKWSLTVRGPEDVLSNQNLYAGDQVKLLIEVTREEAVEWKDIKRKVLAACKQLELEVYGAKMEIKTVKRKERLHVANCGPSNQEIFEHFCKAEKISQASKTIAEEIINGVSNRRAADNTRR
jgi:predicted phosphodiesterase